MQTKATDKDLLLKKLPEQILSPNGQRKKKKKKQDPYM